MKFLAFATLIIIFSSLVRSRAFAQTPWPPKEWQDSISCKHTRGGTVCSFNYPCSQVLFKNGDTLNNCRFRDWFHNCEFLPENKTKSFVKPTTTIEYIRTKISSGYVEYRVMNRTLFRVYKEKRKAAIYCGNNSMDPTNLTYPVLIIDYRKKISLYPFFKSFKPKRRKIILLNFINNRYGCHYDVAHFANVDEMLDFILDEENKRIDSRSGKAAS